MRLALAREGGGGTRASLAELMSRVEGEAGLTAREKEIAMSAVLGKTDRAIAEARGISVATVRTHLKHIFAKLGVSNRTELARRIALPAAERD